MAFSDRFDALLESKGVSNYRLSKDIDVPDSSIGYWRKGTRQPALDNLIKLSNYFCVSVDYLLEKTDDPTPNGLSEDASRLYAVLIEAGIVKAGEDLTDKQLIAISDVMKANSELIRKITKDYYSNKG